MEMFKIMSLLKNKNPFIDLRKLKDSIEATEEQILKEQEEFKKNAERTRERIHAGVRPPGKKFRL